jgi:hypothetical protein
MRQSKSESRSLHAALAALAQVTVLALLAATAGAQDASTTVKIKKWKVDPVELLDKPEGKVVASKPAAEMPTEAVRTGQGWLKVTVGGQDYFVEASQARTDLKLSGKPKCEQLDGTTGHAASRGVGEDGCVK